MVGKVALKPRYDHRHLLGIDIRPGPAGGAVSPIVRSLAAPLVVMLVLHALNAASGGAVAIRHRGHGI